MNSPEEIAKFANELVGQKRADFLKQACKNDEKLFVEVTRFLAPEPTLFPTIDHELESNQPSNRFDTDATREHLSTPIASASKDHNPTYSIASPNEICGSDEYQAGQSIGPFILIRPLGEGGMGSVWLADQTVPVKRRVAFKVIKAGASSKQILARFEVERQALALMNHPNIAKILDAGSTPTGEPFFAMEPVLGKTIVQYCNENALDVDQRLKLFRDVCSGVQHAHQKGIIHRDLKPSNILVSTVDGKPVPKVIDFGLAKAMESTHRLTDQSIVTGIGQILGTLKYMSPEQASIDTADIDTRTDIYSLGIILYELLTGSVPLDDESIQGLAVLKILEFIRDQEPPKPSSKLTSNSSDKLSAITSERRTDSSRLGRVLKGDLDWIVMKSIEKERERRYDSASGLADDIERYLKSEPIEARPPSISYRLKKFTNKNRTVVAATALIVIALIGGISGTAWGLVNAELARVDAVNAWEAEAKRADGERQAKLEVQQRMEQVEQSNKLLGGIFDDLDIDDIREGDEPLEAVIAKRLTDVAKELEGSSIGDAIAVANLQDQLASALLSLGFASDAVKLYEQALKVRKSELGLNHIQTLSTMNNLAAGYSAIGKIEKSIDLLEKTVDLKTIEFGENHPDTILGLINLAGVLYKSGNYERSLAIAERAIKLNASCEIKEETTLINSQGIVAACHGALGRFDTALEDSKKTLELAKAQLGENHPKTLEVMSNLAVAFKETGDLQRALEIQKEAFEIINRKLGPTHPKTFSAMANLASGYLSTGDTKQAIAHYEEVLELRTAKLGELHPDTLTSAFQLANGMYKDSRYDEARKLFETNLTQRKSILGESHPQTRSTLASLAKCYVSLHQMDKAIPLLELSVQFSRSELGEMHPETLTRISNLAKGYSAMGDIAKAVPLYEEALRLRSKLIGANHPKTLNSINSLAVTYYRTGQTEKALPILIEAVELSKGVYGVDHPKTLQFMGNLAAFYQTLNRMDEALELHQRTLDLKIKKLGPEHADSLSTMNNLATLYLVQKQFKDALPLFKKALEIQKRTLGADHRQSLFTMNNLGSCYHAMGQLDKSIPLLRETLQLRESKLGREHLETLQTIHNLAANLNSNHQYDEAIVLLQEAVKAIPQYPVLGSAQKELRKSYSESGQLEKFLSVVEIDVDYARTELADQPDKLAENLESIGKEVLAAGSPTQAEIIFLESMQSRSNKEEDWKYHYTVCLAGDALLKQAIATDASASTPPEPSEEIEQAKSTMMAQSNKQLLTGLTELKRLSEDIPEKDRQRIIGEAIGMLLNHARESGDEEQIKKWTAETQSLNSRSFDPSNKN